MMGQDGERRRNIVVTMPDDPTSNRAGWPDEFGLGARLGTRTRYLTDLIWVERLIREHFVREAQDEYDMVSVPQALMQYVATYADGEDAGARVDLDLPLEQLKSLHLKLWRNTPTGE